MVTLCDATAVVVLAEAAAQAHDQAHKQRPVVVYLY